MTNATPHAVTLTGQAVSLEPLAIDHAAALLESAKSDEIWRYTVDRPQTIQLMRDYIARALADRDNGNSIPFAVKHLASNRLIGATRFCGMNPARRILEIGYTWYAPEFWRTRVNTECKYLLLTYAFETLKYVRVEFQVNAHNARSRSAVLRLGALEEGTLRSRMAKANGERIDAVFFSILDQEWPSVKTKLEGALES